MNTNSIKTIRKERIRFLLILLLISFLFLKTHKRGVITQAESRFPSLPGVFLLILIKGFAILKILVPKTVFLKKLGRVVFVVLIGDPFLGVVVRRVGLFLIRNGISAQASGLRKLNDLVKDVAVVFANRRSTEVIEQKQAIICE